MPKDRIHYCSSPPLLLDILILGNVSPGKELGESTSAPPSLTPQVRAVQALRTPSLQYPDLHPLCSLPNSCTLVSACSLLSLTHRDTCLPVQFLMSHVIHHSVASEPSLHILDFLVWHSGPFRAWPLPLFPSHHPGSLLCGTSNVPYF